MASEHSDSQDTNSTSLVEESFNISFENIKYTVRHKLFSREHKTILDDVSGTFNAGELTVIIGQSGAGKSTLMDILSGYTKPTSGSLLINGRVRNEMSFRRRSCYIFQNDLVQNPLTIQESLSIAADLKLGNHISKEQKKSRVQEIISSLGLDEARNTKVTKLSGGQRKRLSIGLELISDPPITFIDEPTSGLDSSMAKTIVHILHLLARQGRTVVATMHQPSANLLPMIDKLYVMVDGQCAYVGSVPQLIPCLESMDLTCPPYHNPVDFLMEKSGENLYQNKMIESSENGKCIKWSSSRAHNAKNHLVDDEVGLSLLPAPEEGPTNKILLALKTTYATSVWQQFTTLNRRSLLGILRDPSPTLRLILIHCCMASSLGGLLYNIGNNAEYTRLNYNFLFFSLMFLMFTAFTSVAIRFTEEISAIRREHFNRWYTAEAYYLTTLVTTLPIQTICTLSFAIISYWLTGQSMEMQRFLSFCLILLIVSYVALFKGLITGSMFNVRNGVIFGPFMLMPFVLFSGFFLRQCDAPYFMRWMFQLSFIKHGLVGLLLTIFGANRPNLMCSILYCHYKSPAQFLRDTGIRDEQYTDLLGILFGIGAIVTLLALLLFKARLKVKW